MSFAPLFLRPFGIADELLSFFANTKEWRLPPMVLAFFTDVALILPRISATGAISTRVCSQQARV